MYVFIADITLIFLNATMWYNYPHPPSGFLLIIPPSKLAFMDSDSPPTAPKKPPASPRRPGWFLGSLFLYPYFY